MSVIETIYLLCAFFFKKNNISLMTCHWARLFAFELIYEIQLNILWQLLIYLFQIADKEMNQIRQNFLLKSQVYNGFI